MVSGKPAWEDCGSDILFRIGFSDELPKFPAQLSDLGRNFLEKSNLKSAKERRSYRVEKSRVELEELEGIGTKLANAIWFQRDKKLKCCYLNKYKARNSDSLVRSVGESALTM
ncbi:hypothetical protein PVL29_005361 [Vitis rotundifolia]|uniref:Uncharacterized protein n=1 Tax=Vitis rotundifolia TaxID=103349 RepID=A0AA39AAS5_VITRO|nr:hypothetical protein PVL29_005361 [Vitis rotundifolia]